MAEQYLEDLQQTQAQPQAQQQTNTSQPLYLEDLQGNNQQQEQGGIKPLQNTFGQQAQSTQNPLSIGESAISALPRTPEGKAEAIRRMQLPFVNDVSIDNDGKSVLINGQKFEDMDISHPMTVIKGLSRFVGHNLSMLGQIGGLALAPETGGASALAIQGLFSATGSMIGEEAQQLGAQAVSGEKPSMGATITQGAIGGAAPYIGAGIEKGLGVAAQGLRAMQKPTENLVLKLGDSFPEVAETLLGINRGDAQHILDTVKEGRSLKTVFNGKIGDLPTADVGVPNALANRVFYGGDNVENTTENFINTYKGHIANAQRPEDIKLIDNIYQDTHKLTPEALDTIKKNDASVLTNPFYASDGGGRNVAEKVSSMLSSGKEAKFDDAYTQAVGNLYKQGTKSQMSLADEYGNVITKLGPISQNNPNGVGALLSSGAVNPNYGTRQEREAINNFLNIFEGSGVGKSKDIQQILDIASAKGASIEVGGKINKVSDLVGNLNEVSASKAYEFMKYAKTPLNIVNKIGGEASAPIGEFVKGVSDKLATLSPELAGLNKQYSEFMDLNGIMGNIKGGSLNDVNALKAAYKNPTVQSAVSNLDNLLGTKMLPEVNRLGTANEIKGVDFDNSKNLFMKKLKGINDLKNPAIDEIKNQLRSFDAVSRLKFLQDAQDHASASEFINKPQSFFKSKYMGYLLAGQIVGGPLGMLGSLGVGMTVTNPRNVMKALMAGQGVLQDNVIPKAIEGAGKKVASKAGQVALSQILRKQK